MKVKDIMTKDPACGLPEDSLERIAHLMIENNCGAIPIIENRDTMRPVGMITDRDIAISTVALGKDPLHMTAAEIMSFPPLTVRAEASIDDCCEKMEKNLVRRMLVVDHHGALRGIVAQADVARKAPRYEVAELVKDISMPGRAATV